MSDLPAGPVTLGERRCRNCGKGLFEVGYVGPHIGANCSNCGHSLSGWIPKHELGIKPLQIKRPGIGFQARSEILARYRHRCAWCGADDSTLEIGHILPYAQIEPPHADHPANLAPTCKVCNAGAHLVQSFDITMLLRAAVKWMATNEKSTSVCFEVRELGLARIPVPGGEESSRDSWRLDFGNNE